MWTALLRWMNQSRKDQRSQYLETPRLRTSPGEIFSRVCERVLPLSFRRLWHDAPPVGRTLSLDVFEDRLLFSAAPAPMPAPAPAEVVVVAPVDAPVAPSVEAEATTTNSSTEGIPSATPENRQDAYGVEQVAVEAGEEFTGATLIVVDSTVEGYESLLEKLSSYQSGRTDLLILDQQRDGVEQITERLEQLGQTRAIHIISHGDEAGLHIGSSWLSSDTIPLQAKNLEEWQTLMTADADILFYGCDLAANASGQQFLQTVSVLTGADVAASTNATGAANLGGDWNLEYQYGSLEAESLASQVSLFDWNGLLTTNAYQQGNVGYANSSDTSISSDAPNTPDGTSVQVAVGGEASQTGLIKFENLFGTGPGQIPPGSKITSASLRFNVVTGTATDSTIGLYRVLGPTWTEGSTWDSLGGGLTRDEAEVATVADAVVSNTTQTGMQTVGGLRETLQAWSDGETNNGWALFGDNASAWAFTSADETTTALRPMLIVDFTPPPAVTVDLRSTNEIRVNPVTTGTQSTSTNSRNTHDSVGIDANGNFVVVWTSDAGDGSGTAVYAQRYDSRGVAQGSAFQVNQTTANNQQWASVAVKADGGFIVTWTSQEQDGNGQGVYARVFDASGVGGAEFQVNTTTAGDQQASTIGASADGSFVIAWEGNGPDDSIGIFAQRFDSSGAKVGNEFRVNDVTANNQSDVAIAVSRDGQFMVVWDDSLGTHGRRFDSNGSALDLTDLLIQLGQTSGNADVATNGNGNYHVVWSTAGGTGGSGRGVWQLNLNSSDLTPGTPVQVTSSTVNNQTEPSLFSSANGDYIITWQGSGPGESAGVFARKFTSDGTPVGTEFRLNDTLSGSQIFASGAMLDLHNFVTVWSGNGSGDSTGVYASAFGTLDNQSSLLLTTNGNVSSSGSSSLGSWTTGDVLTLGEPNLTLGENTSGRLSVLGNINAFASDGEVKIKGLDVIQRDVLVAVGTKQIQLHAGDILFSVDGAETLGGFTVQSDDILVLRPSAPGNYANGTILMLFDGLQSVDDGSIEQMSDFDLVDRDTQMGDVTLHAGDLIVADRKNGETVIQLFQAATAGLGTTGGTVSTILKGSEIGLNSGEIAGLQFVERDVRMGGMTFLSGDLLVSTRNDTTIGSNNYLMTRNDVARLSVSKTSVYGPASVIASLAVDGSDVALHSSNESIQALAIVHTSTPPKAQNETYTVSEGGTFSSQDQWDLNSWDSRMRLTFNNSSRAESLTDFPILVTLDTNRFDYSQAQSNGADIRFVDADGTVLDYEIETWNPNGQSAIWVKVPRIDANSSSDSIWMYYGNAAASDAQNATGVWSNGYVGVWHLNGNPSGTQAIQDSSASHDDGTVVEMDASNQINGPIGGALKFDGVNEYIRIATIGGDSTAINPAQLTIEAWAQSTGDTGTAERIVNRRNIVNNTPYESYGLATSSNDRSRLVNSIGTPDLVGTAGSLPEDRWRYVTGVLSGGNSSLYVDGVLNSTQSGVSSLGSSNAEITIGAGEMGLTSAISQYWKGGIDEVRLSNVVRSAAWTSAQYASMTDSMITYGDRQTFSGLLDNDTSPSGSPLTVSRADLSELEGIAHVTIIDDGRMMITPQIKSLSAGESLSRQITYTVMDENGNSDQATATIVIQGVNDSPVFDESNQPFTLSSIPMGAETSGDTVESILASGGETPITDADNGTVIGIAVTSVDQTHGQWQYSLDGSTWSSFDGVGNSSATLLDTTARIRFVPAPEFSGIAGGLTFRAWDQTTGVSGQTGVDTSVAGGSSAFSALTATASIEVIAPSDPPIVGTNSGATVVEGGGVILSSVHLTTSDTDNTTGELVYSVTTPPAGGCLERVSAPGSAITSFTQADLDAGEIRYVHDGGEAANDSFTFSVTDGTTSISGSFVITVTPVNDVPVLDKNLGLTVAEGQVQVLSSSVLNTFDPENGPEGVTYTLTTPLSVGHLALATDPETAITTFTQAQVNDSQLVYVHEGTETASDGFDFRVTDGEYTLTGSFAVTVTPVNDVPVTDACSMTLSEGQTVLLSPSNLLTQDDDTPAASLTYTVNSVTNGQFELVQSPGTAINSFTQEDINSSRVQFVHDGGEFAPEISLSVSDGESSVGPCAMSIMFTNVNDSPVVLPATFQVGENATNGTVVGQVTVLDPDVGERHTFSLLNGPSNAYFTIDSETGEIQVADGSALDFEAQSIHQLQVQVVDSEGVVTQGAVQIDLVDINEAPIALGLSDVSGTEDQPIAVVDLRAGWMDPDSDGLTYQILSMMNPGLLSSASISPQGELTLVAASNEFGSNLITLQATDAHGLTSTTTLSVTLTPVNDAPVANSDTFENSVSTAIRFDAATLLDNDCDVDSSNLSVVIKKLPEYGTLRTRADGTYVYVPRNGYTGTDTFEYAVSDGFLLSQNAVVTINVLAVAPSPSQSQTNAWDSGANMSNSATNSSSADGGNPTDNRPALHNAPLMAASNVPAPNGSFPSSHGSESASMTTEVSLWTQDDDRVLQAVYRGRQLADESDLFGRPRSATDTSRPSTRALSRDLRVSSRLDSESGTASLLNSIAETRIDPGYVLGLQSNQMAFEQVKESLQSDLANKLVFEVPALAGASLSVGYVVWMLRGGVLITSLLAQMPAWRIVDPLVVLESLDKSDEDDESIGSLVEQGQSEHEPAV